MSVGPDQRIHKVFRFPNAMVMVFDHDGRQLPEYQGRLPDVWDALAARLPAEAKVIEASGGKWSRKGA